MIWPFSSITLCSRLILTLLLAVGLSACDSDESLSDTASNAPLAFPMPQKIRTTSTINQALVGAELITNAGTIALMRDGDTFTGTVSIEPGSRFSYTVNIFETVNGVRLVLASQSGNTTVNEDINITVGDNYLFPDDDNDGFSNLDERVVNSDPANSVSTPNNIDGTPSQAGLVQFSPAEYSVAEATGTVSVFVSRLAGSQGAVSVSYDLVAETAVAGQDYRASSGQLSWSDGDDTPRTIFVEVFGDDDFEGSETFVVALSSANGGVAIGNGRARVEIIDSTPEPQPGTIQFASSQASGSEDNGSISITVERVGGSDNALTVDYSFTDGDAVNGVDYIGDNATLSWDDGDSSPRIITVPINTDSDDEATERFSISLSNPTGGATLGTALTTVDILDSTPTPTPGELQFSASNYSFTEDTTGTITVVRTNGSDGALTVEYTFTAGSATDGTDYTATNGQLSWTDGDASARNITIEILADAVTEPPETLSIALQNVTGGASLSNASATITINDATQQPVPGNVQLTAAALSVDEGDSIDLTIERLNGQDGAVTVSYSLLAGSAQAGSDYVDNTTTVEWASGESGARTITVTTLTDDLNEGDETLTVQLGAPTGGASLLRDSTVLTIVDTTPAATPGTLTFAAQSGAIDEGQTRDIIVQRSNGADGAVSVDFQTATGSASAADFTAAAGTLNWADGDTTDRTISISALTDADVEGSETFDLQLLTPGGGASLGQSTLTLTITDTTTAPVPGRIEFLASDGLVTEGESITLQVARRLGSDGAVSVLFATADGTAIGGTDYTANSGQLNWADGDTSNRSITIATTSDAAAESNENLSVTLTSPDGGATLGLSSLDVIIVDSTVVAQPGTLSFDSSQSSLAEGASGDIIVTRSGGSDGAVSVDYSITGGTADATDHNLGNGTLSWADGDTGNRVIAATAAVDALAETAETVILTLQNASGDASIGSAAHTLTINDNAPPASPGALAFTATTGSVTEGGSITISVSRSGGSDGAVDVNYNVTGGTAGSDDFSLTGDTLQWADGDTVDQSFLVNGLSDDLTEGDETIIITLSNPGAGATLGANSTFTLTLNDDAPVAQAGILSFASSDASVTEGSSISLQVNRTGGSDGAVSVAYAIAGGSADSDDHDIEANTLNWLDGDSGVRTILVNASTDSEAEPDETVELLLSNATGDATIGQATLTLTLVDSAPAADAGTLTLAATAVDVDEGQSATLAVSRSGGTDGAVSVTYNVTGGTASSDDHNLQTGELNWADGDDSDQLINIEAATDSEVETDETVVIELTAPTNGASASATSGSFNIVDTTPPPGPGEIRFQTALLSVEEGDSIDIVVERVDGTVGEVQATYTVTNETASPADHDVVSGTVTFADGSAAPQIIPLAATIDADSEGAETLLITLSAPSNGAELGLAEVQIVINDPVVASKFQALKTDGLWEICFQSTAANGSGAWASQPSAIDPTIARCARQCGDSRVADADLPGWGFDTAAARACVINRAGEGTLAQMPIYQPQRTLFATRLQAAYFSGAAQPWFCQRQQRADMNQLFEPADNIGHWFDFAADGTYLYAQTTGIDETPARLDNGIWAAGGRTLTLDRLDRNYRNIETVSSSQMFLYQDANSRYSCHSADEPG